MRPLNLEKMPREYSSLDSLEEIKKYIEKIDFLMIVKKMILRDGWKKKEAQETSIFYKNFLFLQKKYGHRYSIIPSEEVDIFWHNHILDTDKYHTDCKNIFGRYLHHYPYEGIDEKSSIKNIQYAFQKTQYLHEKEFGYRIPKIRKKWHEKILSKLVMEINKRH